MAFWDNLGQKASETTAKAVQKAKNLSDIAKYHSMISEEETRINNLYYQVGKLYLTVHGNDPEPDFAGFVSSIAESSRKIDIYKQQILELRGVQRCPRCGAEISQGAAFCSACGAPLPHESAPIPEDLMQCSSCGALIRKGVRFCTACGTPVESPSPEAVAAPEPAAAPSELPVPEAPSAPETPFEPEIPPVPEHPAPSPAGKICPQCGAALGDDLNFCTNCGARL